MTERLIMTGIVTLSMCFVLTAIFGIFNAGNDAAQAILQPIGLVEATLATSLMLYDAIRRIWS